ncbi:MAG: beta-propeller domain-containing protein, partial [Deltaproteobacteria bacterium]|nr:beta-propeller domain-containing protein [Deltaproteobacteria bacterium]
HLSDSRLVGDVLYLVTAEDHDCSTCPTEPTTFISSIGVGGSGVPVVIDQLSYEQPDVGEQGFRRSVMATEDRMYVAGIEWDGISNTGHSTIQVVDISNPDGTLVQGAAVEAAGQILNRWQMDELDGVLRVISQPGVWSSEEVPVVQTFTVESSQVVTPLGSLAITLPVPESLRSVRFDGARAYAITAQAPEPYDPTPGAELDPPPPPVDSCGPGCDPLFVIDLSNPAEPAQMGSLKMPGWVFHMEPRGEHLFALGFESTYPLGQLSVSMFDVDDGNDPKMIERVTFGGDWTGLAEDQSRIHKAFSVLDDQGLILVPYGWWDLEIWMDCWDDPCGGGCWEEGEWVQRGAVKVLSFDSFSMTDRGDAPLESWALRALIHEDDLLAVSNEEVRRFDITSAPTQLDQLWL